MINRLKHLVPISLLLFSFGIDAVYALTFKLPKNGNTVGEAYKIHAEAGDTLFTIAEQHDIGVYDIVHANPKVSDKKLKTTTTVVIPAEFQLPDAPREGIVLDLTQMRVYYYHANEDMVSTYPVGIGRQGWSTPTGETTIVSKQAHPDWHPPDSIRREAERNGKTLPLVVPAGPNNPLGQYALHLGFKGILMHGTNKPRSIGLQSSHGCIRLYANDIKELFTLVPIGTKVRVVY